jgi:hypothetical protein
MPDTRHHRGAHPEDAALFAPAQWPALQQASADLWWLLDHDYAMTSALELVGNRHRLTQRQRTAVSRGACSADQCARRAQHQVASPALEGAELWLDGYNVLITIESALAGAVILHARDGCYRDMASLHGTYRTVGETVPAIILIGRTLDRWQVARVHWLLDRPVSNSGRLKALLLDTAAENGWPWEVQLEFNPDELLAGSSAIVATADSAVLDRGVRLYDLAAALVPGMVAPPRVLELASPPLAA